MVFRRSIRKEKKSTRGLFVVTAVDITLEVHSSSVGIKLLFLEVVFDANCVND